jgi:hypothetical protein
MNGSRWRHTPAARIIAGVIAFALMTVACSDSDPASTGSEGSDPQRGTSAVGTSEDHSGGTAAEEGAVAGRGAEAPVPLLESGQRIAAERSGPTADLITIQEEPYIGAAIYPRPDYEANPWSQWGQGIALEDGRVLTAIGDHLGADANSYLFVYDPDAGTLTRFADVLSALDHTPGSWGYGKVHSQMVDAGDGGIYFTTYYGTRRGLSFDGSYQGDVLFRLDKETLELQPVTVPVPGFGVPSLATDGNGRVYGEAVDPLLDEDVYPKGGFFVYDTAEGSVTQFAEDDRHNTFRNIMVEPDGTAWYAAEGDGLFRYDPAADETSLSDVQLSAGLRASTTPTADGTIYGVTAEPWEFFAFSPDGEVRNLGFAEWYSTSLALLPDESAFLYVPGAHGSSWYSNSPLYAVDTATGEQTTVVELLEPVREEFGLVLGGTYSVTVDPGRNYAHIGFNAGTTGDDPWGEVVFVVVELP